MSERYLILHKVSGEPAFDIAIRLETEEEIWIIPTSGHRAYPYKKWPLTTLFVPESTFDEMIPNDWPDHYNLSKSAIEPNVYLNFGEMMKALIPQGSFLRRF